MTADLKDSVLFTEKSLLGISEDDTTFDNEIVLQINSALFTLGQLGISQASDYFSISDGENVWSEVLKDRKDLEAVKTYIYLKLRQTFDPPANSFVLTSIEKQIEELEWRLNAQVETPGGTDAGSIQ